MNEDFACLSEGTFFPRGGGMNTATTLLPLPASGERETGVANLNLRTGRSAREDG